VIIYNGILIWKLEMKQGKNVMIIDLPVPRIKLKKYTKALKRTYDANPSFCEASRNYEVIIV
jgi:hypothetical protein